MDKDLLKFINGETNAVKINDIVISRETTNLGMEFIHIQPIDMQNDLYTFWHNPKKLKKKSDRPTGGGKKAYVMLMVDKIKSLKGDNSEALGSATLLINNIEWGTGRLINKRTKKALKFDDLKEIYGCSNDKLTAKINKMKSIDLLTHNSEGYFISPDFIKKGGGKRDKEGG